MSIYSEVGNWALQGAIKRAPLALTGIAAAAGLGFLASKGQPQGAVEGTVGNIGSAFTGLMAGATLGFAGGAGLMVAAKHSAPLRPYVGRFLTSVLSSRPVQKIVGSATSMPTTGTARLGMEQITGFMQRFATPHGEAANHLIKMLESKKASIMYAAAPAAIAGGVLGAGTGYFSGAWRAGARLSGPQGAQY